MKKLIFVIGSVLLTGSLLTGLNVKANSRINAVYVSAQDEAKKEKITEDKLPQPVKDVLAGNDYKGWKTDAIYLVKGEKEYYEITLKLNTDTKTVKLDKEGKVVE